MAPRYGGTRASPSGLVEGATRTSYSNAQASGLVSGRHAVATRARLQQPLSRMSRYISVMRQRPANARLAVASLKQTRDSVHRDMDRRRGGVNAPARTKWGCGQAQLEDHAGLGDTMTAREQWRPGSESNRRTRLCRPLHDHSATWPLLAALAITRINPSLKKQNLGGPRLQKLERETRLELATPTLARSCSTN